MEKHMLIYKIFKISKILEVENQHLHRIMKKLDIDCEKLEKLVKKSKTEEKIFREFAKTLKKM